MVASKAQPKYMRVRNWIRQKIDSGEWAYGSQIPHETELLEMLGVSTTTVKQALQGLVQEGLLIRRRKSGTFVCDPQVPSPIKGRNLRLGVLSWLHVGPSFNTSGLLKDFTLGALGALNMLTIEPAFSVSKRQQTTRAVWAQPLRGIAVECVGPFTNSPVRNPPFEAIKAMRFDGIVTFGIIENEFLRKVLALGVPTVIADYPSQKLGEASDLVYADPQSGYRTAVEQLLAQGARNIHFIGARIRDPNVVLKSESDAKVSFGKRIDPDSFLRLSAFRHAMDACGQDVPESRVHFVASDDRERSKLAAHMAALPGSERPDAVVCHDAGTADWLIERFRSVKHKLMGAGGCDGYHYGPAMGISVNGKQMGETATELILERLKNPRRPFLNVGVRMQYRAEQQAPLPLAMAETS